MHLVVCAFARIMYLLHSLSSAYICRQVRAVQPGPRLRPARRAAGRSQCLQPPLLPLPQHQGMMQEAELRLALLAASCNRPLRSSRVQDKGTWLPGNRGGGGGGIGAWHSVSWSGPGPVPVWTHISAPDPFRLICRAMWLPPAATRAPLAAWCMTTTGVLSYAHVFGHLEGLRPLA